MSWILLGMQHIHNNTHKDQTLGGSIMNSFICAVQEKRKKKTPRKMLIIVAQDIKGLTTFKYKYGMWIYTFKSQICFLEPIMEVYFSGKSKENT